MKPADRPTALRIATLVLCASSLLSGCVSFLTSEKAEDTSRGLRYSLPQPFLLVTPKTDGTITVQQVFLPDADKTYTIRQTSILAKHSLDVSLKNGLLESIVLTSDGAGVSEKIIEGYAELEKARIEAEATAAKEAADNAAELSETLRENKTACDKATALVEFYESQQQSTEVIAELLEARADKVSACFEFSAAMADFATLPVEEGQVVNYSGSQPNVPKAAGPVLYQIVQTDDAVNLIAVEFPDSTDKNRQVAFETALHAAVTPVSIPFSVTPSTVTLPGSYDKFTLNTNTRIRSVDVRTFNRRDKKEDQNYKLTADLQENETTVNFTVQPPLRSGKYELLSCYTPLHGNVCFPHTTTIVRE